MAAASPPWELLGTAAGQSYDGEAITQLMHGLQCADLARQEGASEPLQLAALFHDLGHLLVGDAGAASLEGVDKKHEAIGARFLDRWYGAAVSEPVRLHVEAKRYLARDEAYVASLSEESARTLGLQGGAMDDTEAEAFLAEDHARSALDLRRWDDLGKDPKWDAPGLDTWIALAAEFARTLSD